MRIARALPLVGLLTAAACSDSTGPGRSTPPATGFIVLNGSQAPGLTLRSLDGADSSFIAFTPADLFDGGSITVANDTVLSTSSEQRGDQLWVAELRTGAVTRFQLPAGSDPAGADFVNRPEGRIAVALRASRAVALLRPVVGASAVTLIPDVGRCPVDVAAHGGDLWVLDANAECSTFTVTGPARLIRIRASGTARDTVRLPAAARGTGGSIMIVGDDAFVSTDGDADFATFPAIFEVPGHVARVNLTTRTVAATRALPQGTYGAGLRIGADGRLYATAFTTGDFSAQRVFRLEPQALAFAGPFASGTQHLSLVTTGTTQANCVAATADAAGNVLCLETNFATAGASRVHVIVPGGAPLRSLAVGQYGNDIVLR